MKIRPDTVEPVNAFLEAGRATGQQYRIECTRGCPADHRERVFNVFRQHIANRLQHTRLVGITCAATRQDKAGYRFFFFLFE